MKQVFVDSGGFFAHLAGTDAHHERALALFQKAKAQGWSLITTNAIVFETYTLLLYRTRNGRAHALAFLESMEGGCVLSSVSRLQTKLLPSHSSERMGTKPTLCVMPLALL